jgi:N-methylhydantoinase A/oxoprolinase/acetone carboxylase beta subunit
VIEALPGSGPPDARVFVGIDVGGTFTDLTVYDLGSGTTRAVKVPSDRDAPDRAVMDGLARAAVPADAVRLIVHGTTVATNALLERRGARAAFLTTEGFRDVLELGRTTRLVPNSLYDPYFRRPAPLVPRRDRATVAERVESDGRVTRALDESALHALASAWKERGIEAVVVGFLNSYRNPAHEECAAAILSRHFVHVTASSAVLNEVREFERFSVAAVNGYVMPLMASYVGRLTAAVAESYPKAGFYTVASTAGCCPRRPRGLSLSARCCPARRPESPRPCTWPAPRAFRTLSPTTWAGPRRMWRSWRTAPFRSSAKRCSRGS